MKSNHAMQLTGSDVTVAAPRSPHHAATAPSPPVADLVLVSRCYACPGLSAPKTDAKIAETLGIPKAGTFLGSVPTAAVATSRMPAAAAVVSRSSLLAWALCPSSRSFPVRAAPLLPPSRRRHLYPPDRTRLFHRPRPRWLSPPFHQRPALRPLPRHSARHCGVIHSSASLAPRSTVSSSPATSNTSRSVQTISAIHHGQSRSPKRRPRRSIRNDRNG